MVNKSFFVNLSKLRKNAERVNNYSLIFYIDEFNEEFNKLQELKQLEIKDKILIEHITTTVKKLQKKILFYIKNNNKINEQNEKVIINIPKYKDQQYINLLFVFINQFIDINKDIFCLLNKQLVNKILLPSSGVTDATYNTYKINRLENLYYTPLYECAIIKVLKNHKLKFILKTHIHKVIYEKIHTYLKENNIYKKKNKNSIIIYLYSILINIISTNLPIYSPEINYKIDPQNIKYVFQTNIDKQYKELYTILYNIYNALIDKTYEQIYTAFIDIPKINNQSILHYIILSLNTPLNTPLNNKQLKDFKIDNVKKLISDQFYKSIKDSLNNEKNDAIAAITTKKGELKKIIYTLDKRKIDATKLDDLFSEKELINCIYFIYTNYKNFTYNELSSRITEIERHFLIYNNLFPNINTIVENITTIEYKNDIFNVQFNDIIKKHNNFVFHNFVKFINRINTFKIDNIYYDILKNVIDKKKYKKSKLTKDDTKNIKTFIFINSFELLKQLESNLTTYLYTKYHSSNYHLHRNVCSAVQINIKDSYDYYELLAKFLNNITLYNNKQIKDTIDKYLHEDTVTDDEKAKPPMYEWIINNLLDVQNVKKFKNEQQDKVKKVSNPIKQKKIEDNKQEGNIFYSVLSYVNEKIVTPYFKNNVEDITVNINHFQKETSFMNNLLLFLCNFLRNKKNKPYIKKIIQKILYTIKENKYIKEYVREITNLFENDSSIYKLITDNIDNKNIRLIYNSNNDEFTVYIEGLDEQTNVSNTENDEGNDKIKQINMTKELGEYIKKEYKRVFKKHFTLELNTTIIKNIYNIFENIMNIIFECTLNNKFIINLDNINNNIPNNKKIYDLFNNNKIKLRFRTLCCIIFIQSSYIYMKSYIDMKNEDIYDTLEQSLLSILNNIKINYNTKNTDRENTINYPFIF